MNLTLFKRIDIDIDWCFSVVSVGFTVHKRGFHLSLVFLDISAYYISPQRRSKIKDSFEAAMAKIEALDNEESLLDLDEPYEFGSK